MIASVATFGGALSAQDGPPPPQDAAQFEAQLARPNLLENLGLRQDQIRRIRMMNRDRKPAMEAAQQRLREANRALDMSIYGDSLDEDAVQARLKEFQQAQGEVARIRFQSELELRKILTPDQLARFRMLRARVAEARREAQERRKGEPGERPLQRIRQLSNRRRVN
ncbi:MAG TPA: periplasmic heavy metal sensor [Pyrinomonadaceae bacterium]|nr:periplasmic heavy metal sensor [Pyrinomonadaceae bacterium]